MTIPRPPFALLCLAFALALMPFGRLVEAPMLALSIAGLVLLLRRTPSAEGVPWRALALVYGAFLLPMLLALPDAVAQEKAILTTVASLRFPLFCVCLLALYQGSPHPEVLQTRVLSGLGLIAAALLLLWCLDGLLQFSTGRNLLGYGASEGYINGFFGENENIKLGISVAILAPLALVFARRAWPSWAFWSLLLLIVLLVLLSGKRAAWIALGSELLCLFAYALARGRLTLRQCLLGFMLLIVGCGAAFVSSDWVQRRSTVVFEAASSRDYATLNQASGKRLPIWSTALAMGRDHWINGVGPRGFRYAYADYAEAGDRWARLLPGRGGSRAAHAHQLLLELFAETGVSGLLGYVVLLGVLTGLWRRAASAARRRALPYGVALVGLLFPLNTHPAFYSSWFSLFLWMLLALYFFALCDGRSDEAP